MRCRARSTSPTCLRARQTWRTSAWPRRALGRRAVLPWRMRLAAVRAQPVARLCSPCQAHGGPRPFAPAGKNLVRLDVSDNPLTKAVAPALAALIRSQPNLKVSDYLALLVTKMLCTITDAGGPVFTNASPCCVLALVGTECERHGIERRWHHAAGARACREPLPVGGAGRGTERYYTQG